MLNPDHKDDTQLRWDEQRGEMRLVTKPPPGEIDWPIWAKAMTLVGVVCLLYGIGALWMQQHPVEPPTDEGVPRVASTAPAPQPDPPDAAPAADPGPDQPVLVGKVVAVIDGDTLDVQLSSGRIRVRIESIDAPEHDQPLGAEAKKALASRVLGQTVALDVWEQDDYARTDAYVYHGSENVGLWLVDQGYAWAYHRYLHERSYCDAEFRARAAKRGLWALPEKDRRLPYEWRAHQRTGAPIRWSKHDDDTLQQCLAAVGKHDKAKAKDALAVGTTTP